jgi:REP element-mobilizing transposase RayT
MSLIQGAELQHPVHVTLRTSGQRFFPLPIYSVWEILGRVLSRQRFYVHAAVLMSNHIHLLLTPSENELHGLLRELTHEMSTEIRLKFELHHPHFGLFPSYYEIRHPIYFNRALKYIYRNPVAAGLCQRVEEYPFSTIQWLLGNDRVRFALHETYFHQIMVPFHREEFLSWLNTPFMKGESPCSQEFRFA